MFKSAYFKNEGYNPGKYIILFTFSGIKSNTGICK